LIYCSLIIVAIYQQFKDKDEEVISMSATSTSKLCIIWNKKEYIMMCITISYKTRSNNYLKTSTRS
jgi:hypothetical protein